MARLLHRARGLALHLVAAEHRQPGLVTQVTRLGLGQSGNDYIYLSITRVLQFSHQCTVTLEAGTWSDCFEATAQWKADATSLGEMRLPPHSRPGYSGQWMSGEGQWKLLTIVL